MKLKRLTLADAIPDAKAVIGPSLHNTVFTVKSVQGNMVQLMYFEYGQEIIGGWVDVACLFHPTDEQLNAQLLGA